MNTGFFDPMQLQLFWPLLLALLLGSLVGFEREYIGKSAGIRTNALICVGSALFTLLSLHFPVLVGTQGGVDPSRIAAQVVIGIGFLGGGVIVFRESKVQGLTTAATIWVVAAIGMAIGAGMHLLAVLVSLLTFIMLDLLARFRSWELKFLEEKGKNQIENHES